MAYVMVISIGPVQGFIASARRTSDFAYGSRLLSELAKAIALKLHTDGHTLVFPAGNLAAIPGVPNKLVAVIKRGEPQAIADELCKALFERLHKLYRPVLDKLSEPQKNHAIAQIESLPQFYWAAAAFEELACYADARNRAEALLAARKNTRAFTPVTWGKNTPKSSITGEMESVLPKPNPNDPADAENRWRDYRAGPHEHLSGVDLLKRHGGVKMPFPSTSHMAAKPFMRRVQENAGKNEALQELWNCYVKEVPPDIMEYEKEEYPFFGANDGALLFEERLSAYAREPQWQAGVETALPHLRTFLEEARKQGYGSPDPYYAILLGDGDGMGEVIDKLAQHGGLKAHQALSKALDQFVTAAHELITSHDGAPVYIGGDDVLALLPLHTVLECANAVAEKFATTLAPVTKPYDLKPSLSAGIAIVHHLVPLTDAVDLARAAEKIAKSVDGKNALAITISRRSGGDYTVKAQRAALVERLKQFIGLFATDKLPSGVAYEIRDLVLRLDLERNTDEHVQQAAREDALRILGRKRTAGGEPLDDTTKKALQELIFPRARGRQTEPLDDTTKKALQEIVNAPSVSLLELAYELVVARALADARHPSVWETTKASNV